jgi:DNA-binding response OmpR family regulator
MKILDAFALTYPLEILFVNNRTADLTPTELHLAHLGYQADQAFSAKEVLEMAANKQYDIILLDTRIPDPEQILDMVERPQDNAPILIGLFAGDAPPATGSSLGMRLDSQISLPIKRKEFLSQLKACSVLAGKCGGSNPNEIAKD